MGNIKGKISFNELDPKVKEKIERLASNIDISGNKFTSNNLKEVLNEIFNTKLSISKIDKVELNTITTPGFYCAVNCIGCPPGYNYWSIIVTNSTSLTNGLYVQQIAISENKVDGIYIRRKNSSSGWTPWDKIVTDKDLASVATSGSYNDLKDKPTIGNSYTHPSTHPASMITGLHSVATSGNYSDLKNLPSIPYVMDLLTSSSSTNPLSANQGRILKGLIEDRVEKVNGKGLSTYDFGSYYKNKIEGIEQGANKYVHPDTHPATMISVANSNFSGKDLNSVLNELFTNADNGKKSISSTVGSPLSASDSFDNMNSKLQGLKSTLASKLSSKGQNSSSSDSLNNLINKVSNISVGDYKKGDKISLSQISYNYTTNKLSSYKQERIKIIEKKDDIQYTMIDKQNNIYIRYAKQIVYYNYNKDTMYLLVNIPSSANRGAFYYDRKNDQYYYIATDQSSMYVYKLNSWNKEISTTQVLNGDYYISPTINSVQFYNNEMYIYYSLFYSAGGHETYKIKISSNGIVGTAEHFKHRLSRTTKIIMSKDFSSYFIFRNYRMVQYSLDDSVIKEIQLDKDIVNEDMDIEICFNNSLFLFTDNYICKLINIDSKLETQRLSIGYKKLFIDSDYNLIGYYNGGNEIKKFSFNNETYSQIFSMALPTTGSYDCFNENKLVCQYQNTLIIYTNSEEIISSITLK